jgi:hypothetical protein
VAFIESLYLNLFNFITVQIVWVREAKDGNVDVDHLEDMLKVILGNVWLNELSIFTAFMKTTNIQVAWMVQIRKN